jgi:hypothetical protein
MPDEPIEETPVLDEEGNPIEVVTPFEEYAVDDCTVLEPNEVGAWRVRLPNKAVTGITGDPTTELTLEVLNEWKNNPPAPPTPARNLSKLELKARLDVLGKWSAFVTFLTSIGAWDDFILASFVSTDHPLFTTYAPQVQAGLALTDAEFASLIA